MPPNIALFLCILFVCWLFWTDAKSRPAASATLWIPTIWMIIVGARPVSLWFTSGGGVQGSVGFEEGSPVDRLLYSVLIASGVVVLLCRRKIRLSELASVNKALLVLLIYFGISVFWSEFPLVSLKRYVKLLGMVVMALMVLTEDDYEEAFQAIARRCAFVLLPFSVLLIKYFPEFGVSYDVWSGARMVNGVAEDKNMLGQTCLTLALLLMWSIVRDLKNSNHDNSKLKLLIKGLLLVLSCHLLIISDSLTSLICFIIAVMVFLALDSKTVSKNLGFFIVLTGLTFAVVDWSFGAVDLVLKWVGRDPTLTNRTDIWHELLTLRGDPLLGTGFEGFWMGDRLTAILQKRNINEAHNGYLEIYLNTGLIGVFLFGLWTVSIYKKCRKSLEKNSSFTRLQMTAFVTILFYNLTESGFKGLSLVLFLFLLVGISLPDKDGEMHRLRRKEG